jgi:[ribosomal protein S5]-alanine N-acetyltransferase
MHVQLAPAAIDGVSLFVLTPEHVGEAYVGWLNDPVVNQFLESRFATHDIESTRRFVEQVYASPDSLLLGIHNEAAGGHVGNIKIGPINRYHRTGEIGILIGEKRAWGRGIATAAIRLICDVARNDLALHKVTAGCYATNVGSRKAFEKAGFAVEGTRAQQVQRADGQREDLVLLGRVLG